MEPTHQSVFSKSTFILSWGVSPLKCTNNSRWIKDVSLPLKSCCKVIVIVWLPCVGQLTVLDFLTKYSWGMVGGPEAYLSSACWHADPDLKKSSERAEEKRERLERIKVTVSCQSLIYGFLSGWSVMSWQWAKRIKFVKDAANLNELMGDICEESL